MSTDDCLACECPMSDHVPFHYWFRCWRRHRVMALRERLIRKIDRALLHLHWHM